MEGEKPKKNDRSVRIELLKQILNGKFRIETLPSHCKSSYYFQNFRKIKNTHRVYYTRHTSVVTETCIAKVETNQIGITEMHEYLAEVKEKQAGIAKKIGKIFNSQFPI